MAYKPRFSQPQAQPPKPKLTFKDIFLGFVAVLLSLAITAGLLAMMITNVGRPKTEIKLKNISASMMDRLDALMEQSQFAVQSLQHAAQQPGGEGEGGDGVLETLPPPKKLYTLKDEDLVAPEPNQALFGKTDDPEVLRDIIAQAADLLEGQTLYFDPDRERAPSKEVRYYLDDTIFALTWQEGHDGAAYTMSEVKLAHASQFRRHLADGEYGGDKQYLPTEMAASVNAVVASSGDFYRFRSFGAVVYQGQTKRVDGKFAETCYIDVNGDMSFTYPGEVRTVDQVQALVEEKEIRFSLCFGPILVDNYELVDHSWYGVGEINEEYARAALCQMDKLHYIVVAANFDKGHNRCPTVATFQKHIAATGCKMAYCLDGGQTAAIVMNDELINRPAKGEQRRISDIIYFATAIPEGD